MLSRPQIPVALPARWNWFCKHSAWISAQGRGCRSRPQGLPDLETPVVCLPYRQDHRSRSRGETRMGNILSFLCRKTPCTWQIYQLSGRGPPGGNALPNCSATYCGRGNDSLPTGEGVAFHDPTAWRYLVFHDPPAQIGPPCPSEFRTSSPLSKIWTTVPMRQFAGNLLPAPQRSPTKPPQGPKQAR